MLVAVLLLVQLGRPGAAQQLPLGDRDLSTDILEFVIERAEKKADKSIASDILGFVKNKMENSDEEIYNYILDEKLNEKLSRITTTAARDGLTING